MFFVNLNTNFCNLAYKVLKFRAVIELVSNLMLNYSTYIYLYRVYLKKKHQNIFVLTLKSGILIFRYILRNSCIDVTCTSGHCHIKKMTYIK